MAWRVHLTSRAIQRLDILPGKEKLLAVWLRRDRVAYLDAETGVLNGENTIDAGKLGDSRGESWRLFVERLVAPNDSYLPYVQTARFTAYTTFDGKLRLYHTDGLNLFVEADNKETQLETGEANAFIAVDLDSSTGMIAALDDTGRCHVYRGATRLGAFPLNIRRVVEMRPTVLMAYNGGSIFVTNGEDVVMLNADGTVGKRRTMHYPIGTIACSPDGRLLVTSDRESGVIRTYEGEELEATRQRHAIDLLAGATQVQLMAEMPPPTMALSALTVDNEGKLAFAISGVVCMTEVEALDALPPAQPTLLG